MIAKGTKVLIKTTNGGEMFATLIQNYRFTYDAVIGVNNGYIVIPCWRIKSIQGVA